MQLTPARWARATTSTLPSTDLRPAQRIDGERTNQDGPGSVHRDRGSNYSRNACTVADRQAWG